jgi:hypothetical protein
MAGGCLMRFLLVLFLLFVSTGFVQAVEQIDSAYKQTTASYTNYRDCIRLYKLPFEKLFSLSLASINENKYEIMEIQSRNGYIIFEVDGKEFLLTVMQKDKNYTYLKIAPADNNYYFSSLIPKKIFNLVDLNFNEEIKELTF